MHTTQKGGKKRVTQKRKLRKKNAENKQGRGSYVTEDKEKTEELDRKQSRVTWGGRGEKRRKKDRVT